MLTFYFLGKGLGIVSLEHFVYDFLTKNILLTDQISMPGCLYLPGCDVMDFEINLIFLIEPFFLHDQKAITKT